MAKRIEWTQGTAGKELPLTDFFGDIGPFRTFELRQRIDGGWTLVSLWLPTKQRGKVFKTVEEGKRACAEIVAGFQAWLNS